MGKILWIDTETTGLDHRCNSIIQISFIVEIDGRLMEEFKTHVRPWEDPAFMSKKALKINNFTVEELLDFPPIIEAQEKILNFMDKYINKYDKNDKFILAGYRTGFDLNFFAEFFKRENFKYLWSYIDFVNVFDLHPMISYLNLFGKIDIVNNKLETACNYFGIQLIAHDSLEDIRATRKLAKIVIGNLDWKYIKPVREKR